MLALGWVVLISAPLLAGVLATCALAIVEVKQRSAMAEIHLPFESMKLRFG
jgi:hypothetical protein